MKITGENALMLGAAFIVGGLLFSPNAQAVRYLVVEEPTVVIDKDAKTAKATIVLQNLDTGIKNYKADTGYSGTDPETGQPVVGLGNMIGTNNCAMGGISCEEQATQRVNLENNVSNMVSGYVYYINNITIDGVALEGKLEFTLDDGIITNTFDVSPSVNDKLARTYLLDDPVVNVNEDQTKVSASFDIQNSQDGIKSAHYYLMGIPSGGIPNPTNLRFDFDRDCSGKTEEQCLALEKTPLSITLDEQDFTNYSSFTIRALIIEYSDQSMVKVDGLLKITKGEDEYENTIALAKAPAQDNGSSEAGGESNPVTADNPKTADPVVYVIFAAAVAGLIGAFGIKSKMHR